MTGQHREMLDQVLNLFDISPDYDLDVMTANQSPTQVAAIILARIEPILHRERPDWVLVQGDTTTAVAAAMAAYYAHINVGHVEAGLRTLDKWQPFPEEVNRRMISAIADLHFAPTEQSRRNLLNENVPGDRIVVTGNPVIDALKWTASLSVDWHESGLPSYLLDGTATKLLLVTAHRRENFGPPLEQICWALRDLAFRYDGYVHIVYPVHPNPNVQEPVRRILSDVPNVTLLPPLDYAPLVQLMRDCYLVLTDSGGLQEEAPSFGKPVLVLREVTERPEGVKAGTVRVIGASREAIVRETVRLLEDPVAYQAMATAVNPYGDGYASKRIVGRLLGRDIAPEGGMHGEPMEQLV